MTNLGENFQISPLCITNYLYLLTIQVGEDLMDIVDLEKTSTTYTDYKLPSGILRQFGSFGDAFVLYLHNALITEAKFYYKS